MVICGSYMFEFSQYGHEKTKYNKGGGNRVDSGTFMSNTNCQGIKN